MTLAKALGEVVRYRKHMARMQANTLPRKPCHCGRPAAPHHPDYAKPLEVVWVCRHHHPRSGHAYQLTPEDLAIAATFKQLCRMLRG